MRYVSPSPFNTLIPLYIVFCRDINEIVEIMERLKGKSVLRRFLRKDKHSDALAKHKQGLTYALVIFQVGFFLLTVYMYPC